MSHQQAEPSLLRVHTCFHDRVAVVVVVEGELDLSTTPLLEEQIVGALRRGAEDVVIDLRRLEFMDSSGLRCLVECDQEAQLEGRRFALVQGPDAVRRVFEITGMDGRLTFVDAP